MPANIAEVNGKFAVFTAGEAAWHELGQNVSDAQSWESAIKLAGLDFEVEKRQLEIEGVRIDAYGIFRNDVYTQDKAKAFLGNCGKDYQPIQNKTAFDFVDVLLEAQNGAHYDSAGALGKGERFWVSARVPFDFTVGASDKHQTYLLFASSHDSSIAATGKLVTTRVVCMNTLTAALHERGASFRVKHTKEAGKRLEAAKKMMSGAAQTTKTLAEKLNNLAQRKLDKPTLVDVLNTLFPEDKEKKFQTRRENTLTSILERFEFNDANMFPEQRGTAFNLLNAITGYTDHEKGVRKTSIRDSTVTAEQIRAESSIFGLGDTFKRQALDVILAKAESLPLISTPKYFPMNDVLNADLIG